MMIYKHSTFVSVVASVLLLAIAAVSGTCPEDVIDRVRQCTSHVLPDLSISDRPASYTDHVEVARDTCRDSRLRDAADCIQENLDECKGTTEREQVLQRLIDKEKTLQTVEYFCKHLKVYARHAECISNHHAEVLTCSEEARNNFEVKMNAGATMDTLITGSCRFHAVARGCLTNTTESHCGKEAAKFVYDLLTGQMPPYCELRVGQSDSSTHKWFTRSDDDRRGYETGKNTNSAHTLSTSLTLLAISVLGLLTLNVSGR